jgi:multimeric flavodoxin WrbA
MKITAIIGSPRKDGNCNILVDEAIKGAEENGAEVTKYYLDDLKIEPCHACGHCGNGIDCKTIDDATEVINQILESDNIIFATPIYYGYMTAQAKTLIDRFYSVFVNPQKNFTGKALLIFTHGMPEGSFDDNINLIKQNPFELSGFEVETLDVGGTNPAGAVKKQENKLKEAYNLGKSL